MNNIDSTNTPKYSLPLEGGAGGGLSSPLKGELEGVQVHESS